MAGALLIRNRLHPADTESSGALGGTNHSYFESLIVRPDFWKGMSMRPQAGVTSQSSPYWEDQLLIDDGYQLSGIDPYGPTGFTYDPDADEHEHRQDAAKMVMPPFYRVNSNVLASGINDTDTFIQCTNISATYAVGRKIKIDDEVMVITAKDTALDTLNVTRAQHGTTAVAHLAGAAPKIVANSVPSTIQFPLDTAGTVSRYFFTWDAYYADSFVQTGLTNHKAYQIKTNSNIWLEVNNTYAPTDASEGSFNPVTDTAAFQVRGYAYQIAAPAFDDEPIEPIDNTFAIKPNKWVRYFLLLDVRDLDDPACWYDMGATLVSGIDASTTTLSISTTSMSPSATAMFWGNAYIRIGSEVMQVTNNPPGTNPRTVTVTRGMRGTTAASHSAGDHTYSCCNVLASTWIGDEDRDPVAHFADLPMSISIPDAGIENTLDDFLFEWNTSNSTYVTRSDRDLVAWICNLAILESPTLDPVSEGLIVKPSDRNA